MEEIGVDEATIYTTQDRDMAITAERAPASWLSLSLLHNSANSSFSSSRNGHGTSVQPDRNLLLV
jgi:hypothetical protein